MLILMKIAMKTKELGCLKGVQSDELPVQNTGAWVAG